MTNVTKDVRKQVRQWTGTTWFAYFAIFVSALLYNFGFQSIMTAARTLPSGIGAFALLPGIVDHDLTKYFAFFYLAFNLPVLIYFYRKIKKRFVFRTCFFLLITTIIGVFQMIPAFDSFFTRGLQQLIIKQEVGYTLEQTTYHLIWPMLVLPAVAGALVGTSIALSWKFGGSTAGTDIITYYYSTKRKKQIGTVSMIIAILSILMTFGIFIGLNNQGAKSVWFASIAGSLIYIVTNSSLINHLYPRYKKVAVTIHSSRIMEIVEWMQKDYKHSFRIETSYSMYEHKSKEHVISVMLLLETKSFIEGVKKIDPECWISISRIENVVGRFDTSPVE